MMELEGKNGKSISMALGKNRISHLLGSNFRKGVTSSAIDFRKKKIENLLFLIEFSTDLIIF